MSVLGKFPYLHKCCLCINLRTACILIGIFSILFHLIFMTVRDVIILVTVKQEGERNPIDPSKFYHTKFCFTLIRHYWLHDWLHLCHFLLYNILKMVVSLMNNIFLITSFYHHLIIEQTHYHTGKAFIIM